MVLCKHLYVLSLLAELLCKLLKILAASCKVSEFVLEYDRKTFFVGAAKASCIAKWAQQKCCISAHLDYGHQLGLNITLDYAIGSSSFKVVLLRVES